ncbi:MAG: hypothetical protein AAGB32_04885 [Pseudomonadota bacterium]
MQGLSNVTKESKLAIYVGERPYIEINKQSLFHSYLLLVDETTHPVTILQQLHFDNDGLRFAPHATVGIRKPPELSSSIQSTFLLPIIGGNALEIMHLWDKALNYAFVVSSWPTPFDENPHGSDDVANCRAGVMKVLRLLGIDVSPEDFIEKAGTNNSTLPTIENFGEAAGRFTWQRLLERNKTWLDALDPSEFYLDYNPRERYVGPIPYDLRPMHPNQEIVQHLRL